LTDQYSCTEERIPESDIMAAILDSLRTHAAAAVGASRMIEAQNQRRTRDAGTILKNIAALKEENDRQKNQVKALYEQMALGEIGKSEYLAQKAVLARECDEITGRVAALESELEAERSASLLHSRSVESLKQYAEIQTLTAEIVDTVLEQVAVFPGRRLDITWKFQDNFRRLMEQLDVPQMKDLATTEDRVVRN